MVNRGRIRSVCLVLDCKVGGCGFDSGTGPIPKVLILLINVHVGTCTCTLFALQTADLYLVQMTINKLCWSRLQEEMQITVSSKSTFVLLH